MSNPGFYDELEWRFGILFDDPNGNALDMSARTAMECIFYDKNGAVAFVFLASGAGAGQGTIDVGSAALGIIVLKATVAQHAAVPEEQDYTWTLSDIATPSNPKYLANGEAHIGRAGARTTKFRVLNSFDGSAVQAVVVTADTQLTDLRDEVRGLRDETLGFRNDAAESAEDAATSETQTAIDRGAAEEARDSAEGFAGDAESESEQALTARIGADAARALAEAAALAALAGQTIYLNKAAGIAAVADGAPFWAYGTATGTLDLWRRNGADADLKFTAGSLAELAALGLRVTALEALTHGITTYLDPDPTYIPRHLYDDGSFDDYEDTTDPDNAVHVSQETIRLDFVEAAGIPGNVLAPDFQGRLESTPDDEGTVTRGIRTDDGTTQFGPAPARDFSADIIADKVWAFGAGIAPFCISGELTGTNRGLARVNREAVEWYNTPPAGLPAKQTFSFLPGFEAGILAGTVTRLTLFVGAGQSTVVGTKATPVLTADCPDTGYLFMYDVTPVGSSAPRGPRVLGHEHGPTRNELLDMQRLGLLVPTHESQEADAGETQLTQAAYQYRQRMGNHVAVAVATVGVGSQPYQNIKLGTFAGDNLLAVIRQTWAIAKMNGLDFDVVVVWPQHEGNVAEDQAQYLDKYVKFQAGVSAATALITDGEISNVLFATNGFTNGTNYGYAFTGQSLGQLQFALENPTKGVYASPCFVFGRAIDGTHFTNVGTARDGAYIGRAIANQKLARDALPLHTTGVAISAGAIRGALHLPYGHGTLTTTSPYVSDPGNRGFALVRVDNQVAVPIASVNISGGNEWVLTPTGPPAGVPLEVSHGYRGTPGQPGGPTTGARTPINDGNPDEDFFGDPMPHHLAAQKFTVTF